MFLFKRGKIYHLEYFDEIENHNKRISTKCINKKDALRFLTNFNSKLAKTNTTRFINLKSFQDFYLEHIKQNFSPSYYTTVEVSFRLLIKEVGDIPIKKINYRQLERFLTKTFSRTKEGARTYKIALKSAFNKACKSSKEVRQEYIKNKKEILLSQLYFSLLVLSFPSSLILLFYSLSFLSDAILPHLYRDIH